MSDSQVPPPAYSILVLSQQSSHSRELLTELRKSLPDNIKLYDGFPDELVKFSTVWVVTDRDIAAGRPTEPIFDYLRSIQETWESKHAREANGIADDARWIFVTLDVTVCGPETVLDSEQQYNRFWKKFRSMCSWLPEGSRYIVASASVKTGYNIGKLIDMSLVDPHIYLHGIFKGCKSIADAKLKCSELMAKLDDFGDRHYELNYHKDIPGSLFFRRKEMMSPARR
jgi:hypothetical protein